MRELYGKGKHFLRHSQIFFAIDKSVLKSNAIQMPSSAITNAIDNAITKAFNSAITSVLSQCHFKCHYQCYRY